MAVTQVKGGNIRDKSVTQSDIELSLVKSALTALDSLIVRDKGDGLMKRMLTSVLTTYLDTLYQTKNADLSAIAALTATSGLLKKTGGGLWALDDIEYLPLYKYIFEVEDFRNTWNSYSSGGGMQSIVMSSDGKIISGIDSNGYAYVSLDYGVTWNTYNIGGYPMTVKMSADGSIMVGTDGSTAYVSTNYGVTWNAYSTGNLQSISMSADGSIMAGMNGSTAYVSTNYGVTWNTYSTGGYFPLIIISSDGEIMAGTYNGYVYISSNYGVTWNAYSTGNLQSISMSADGSIMAGADQMGNVYVSLDFGITWNNNYETGIQIQSIMMSVDGKVMATTDQMGNVYVSLDFGITWNTYIIGNQAQSISMSADGKVMAAADGMSFCTSLDYGATWISFIDNNGVSDILISANGSIMAGVNPFGFVFVSKAIAKTIHMIEAQGGNSIQWNEAYSWGNHALAGYLPASGSLVSGHLNVDCSEPGYSAFWGQSVDQEAIVGISTNNTGVRGVSSNHRAVSGMSTKGTSGYFSQGGTLASDVILPAFLIGRYNSGSYNMTAALLHLEENITGSGGVGKILSVFLEYMELIRFDPRVANGSSAVAYFFDTKNTLSTAGAKLLSIRNNGVEKFAVNYDGSIQSPAFKTTTEGGQAIRLVNKTGAASVKGTVVSVSNTTDNAFRANPVDGDMPIGIVYEDGIADGADCWVVISGKAQVLLVNSVATTRGYVAYSSATVAGRIDTSASAPAATQHFREIGHTLESKTAGTNVLVLCIIHFN